jgi:hypothetical protein
VEEKRKEQPETPNPEAAPEPHRHLGLSWLVWPLVLLALYVLSVGPAAKIYVSYELGTKHPRTAKALDTIYEPMVRLAQGYPPANRRLVWYLEVWGVLP